MMHTEVQTSVSPSFACRPWARSGSHVVVLGDLVKSFHVHTLLSIVSDIGELALWSANGPNYADDSLTEVDAATSFARLADVGKLCADFGFITLFREVERNRQSIEAGCSYVELGKIAEVLKTRIQDEYEDILLLWIEEKEYYQKDDLFGLAVGERFKGASLDISEAGACYAVGRYTACVFHLMRVAEYGLKAIGKRVGFPDNRPIWEPVLKFINAELNRNHNEISALFKGDIEFIAGISAHMHAVNLAWRRRVAHVERTYTQEEAKRIMEETKNLMQHIAEKLSESE
jgi:hypothetical protein